jgi:hypothetical protein
MVKTGRAKAIREWVAAHPNATSRDVCAAAAAAGFDYQDVRRELTRMVRAGTLIAERAERNLADLGRPVLRYKVGRSLMLGSTARVANKAHPLRAQPAVAPRRRDVTQAPAPRSMPSQTVEEFMAKGGRVERLPTHWDEYQPHARPRGAKWGA